MITNSTHSRSKHISTPHFQSTFSIFEQLAEDLKRIFPFLGSLMKILNSPRLLIPLINIRNKKMKTWTLLD